MPANELHETCIGQCYPYRCSSLGGTACSSIHHSYSWAENISDIAIYYHRWKWSSNTDKQPLSYAWLTELWEPAKYMQPLQLVGSHVNTTKVVDAELCFFIENATAPH